MSEQGGKKILTTLSFFFCFSTFFFKAKQLCLMHTNQC